MASSKILLDNPHWFTCKIFLCAIASRLRASFIELAQNFIAIHCDVTMALNIGIAQWFCPILQIFDKENVIKWVHFV